MKLDYRNRFVLAVQKTKEMGLELKEIPLPLRNKLSKNKRKNILQLCSQVLNYHGYRSSSDLAKKCTPVHLILQHQLKMHLNLDSYLTVGDRYWDDYIYCEMSYENIKKEPNAPNINKPIKAHVWLTLTDGTVLDCTAEAHADILFNRGEHPIEKCMMYVEPEIKMDGKSGYHRPFIVGLDFLEKAKVCKLQT
jgi:hypothetical protein